MSLKKSFREIMLLLAFTAPALLFYIIFMAVPMFGGIFYSLTDWNGLNKQFNTVGLGNYISIFRDDPGFIHSIFFTFKYVIVLVISQNIIALFLAVLIESRKHSKGLFRTLFFGPNMISLIISTFMWSFIFSTVLPEIANRTMFKFLDQSWVGNPKVSFYSIILVSLWAGVGYLMVIYMAGLQGVPKELKEAAIIDGASGIQSFVHINLPMIYHAITICIFLTLNSSFKVFDVVYALTRGGPGRETQVMTLNIYEEAFANQMRFGYANAKAIVLFIIVLIITLIQVQVMKKREVEV